MTERPRNKLRHKVNKVICSICGKEVSKRKTYMLLDGSRACKTHEESKNQMKQRQDIELKNKRDKKPTSICWNCGRPGILMEYDHSVPKGTRKLRKIWWSKEKDRYMHTKIQHRRYRILCDECLTKLIESQACCPRPQFIDPFKTLSSLFILGQMREDNNNE